MKTRLIQLMPLAGESVGEVPVNYTTPLCATRFVDCGLTRKQLGLTSLMVFFAVLYFAIYCFFIRMALRQLATRSASEFRIANVAVRIQVGFAACSG